MSMDSSFDIIKEAREVFDKEILALEKTRDTLGDGFAQIVDLLVNCTGKVIITGIGKPGHVDTKIAATLASLGTPAFYLHPAEALHGDLGMVQANDVVLITSNSGESEEIIRLLPTLHEIGCATVAVTGNARSTLARECAYRFVFPQLEEACYLHLAPTSSTTALLVLGDALAVVTSRMRNFTEKDFGLNHPAGALGKKLLVKVRDLMYTGTKNAVVVKGCTLRSAIVEMSSKGLSMVTVADEDGGLAGIITDGDLRRMLERGVDVYRENVDAVMTSSPKWIDEREMAVNALQIMNNFRITGMPVLNEQGKVTGSILMQDIIKAGIVR